jgi:hypothetical protein
LFKSFYDTSWHHPGFALAASLLFVFALAARRRFLVAWALLCFFETAIDALFTGGWNPARGTPLERALGITFVILGDLRLFLAIEWVLAKGPYAVGLPSARALVRAVPLAFVVPVLSTIPIQTLPQYFPQDDPFAIHRIFILYEATFVVLWLILRFVVFPRRLATVSPEVRRWVMGLLSFFGLQYGTWVLADAIILATHADVGYLVRLVPNVLYYALFVPFAYFSAPVAWREASGGAR